MSYYHFSAFAVYFMLVKHCVIFVGECHINKFELATFLQRNNNVDVVTITLHK